MIYSKKLQTYVPVKIKHISLDLGNNENYNKYLVFDKKILVGQVSLTDKDYGVFVDLIENKNPELYSGLGKIADQIEVEHCLKRGLTDFSIKSYAALNSHALHYLRGKRFLDIENQKKRKELISKFNTTDVNIIVENIIKNTKAGKQYMTKFLEKVPMFMPKEVIDKYIQIIKKTPLLK